MNNDRKYDVCINICPCETCYCDEEDCILAKAYIQQLNSGWIPITERLPELDKYGEAYVLVSMDDEFIATTTYTKDGFELWADSGEVVAWQSLPEPYKELATDNNVVTIGDKIRESNESLAEFVDNITHACANGNCEKCKMWRDNFQCTFVDILDYLNQPISQSTRQVRYS